MAENLHKISKLVEQDLKGIARELPYTGQAHYDNLVYFYSRYGSFGIDLYISTIPAAYFQPHKASFPKKIGQWFISIKQWLKSL
jgi:hypothetical protein